ncbi:uncharacterized protein METZ01_LOCUS486216, partial [marine metagenome]
PLELPLVLEPGEIDAPELHADPEVY